MSGGRFVWFELMTTDIPGAKDFYPSFIDWKSKPFSKEGNYDLWMAGEDGVGGLMALPDEARKHGVPPHWLGYVSTPDVDAAAKKASSLGGKVVVEAQDIPDVGRFAVLSDPQGAAFAAFKPAKGGSAPSTEGLGHFSWAELNTSDWKSAWKFYAELFGWQKTESMDMGPEYGEYFMFGTDPKKSMGGMSNAANMMKAPPHWLFYVNVKSADDAAKKLADKGGKVLNGPMDVPGGDRVAQCMDPRGAAFGIYSAGKK